MECLNSSSAISVIIDEAEPEQERQGWTEHVEACEFCSAMVNEHRRIRQHVRSLPVRHSSADLRTALRSIARRDRARRITWLKVAASFAAWRLRLSLLLNDLMRPMALPVAGGVISALMLFGALVPDMFVEVHPVHNDVPTVLFTNASVKDASWPVIGDTNIVVDLTIDENGRLTDYTLVSGSPLLRDEGMRRRFESALLLSQFTPANFFGQPMAGKVRVSFRTSRIDIKG